MLHNTHHQNVKVRGTGHHDINGFRYHSLARLMKSRRAAASCGAVLLEELAEGKPGSYPTWCAAARATWSMMSEHPREHAGPRLFENICYDGCKKHVNVDVRTFFHVVVLLPLASSKTVCMRSCLVEPQTPAPDVSQHLLPLKQRQWQRTRHTNEDSPLLLPPTAEALHGCTRTPDTRGTAE